MSFLDEIEAVKENKDLTPDEKKKAIRKLRRQMRKGQIVSKQANVISEELAALEPEAMLQRLIEDSGLPQGDPKLVHYHFSIQGAIARGIPYEKFAEKFQARFGVQPRDYTIHRQGKAIYFGLGPVDQP